MCVLFVKLSSSTMSLTVYISLLSVVIRVRYRWSRLRVLCHLYEICSPVRILSVLNSWITSSIMNSAQGKCREDLSEIEQAFRRGNDNVGEIMNLTGI